MGLLLKAGKKKVLVFVDRTEPLVLTGTGPLSVPRTKFWLSGRKLVARKTFGPNRSMEEPGGSSGVRTERVGATGVSSEHQDTWVQHRMGRGTEPELRLCRLN